MTDVRFGGSAGLLARLRPERVDVADLRDVAEALLPCLTSPGLSVALDVLPDLLKRIAAAGLSAVALPAAEEARAAATAGPAGAAASPAPAAYASR